MSTRQSEDCIISQPGIKCNFYCDDLELSLFRNQSRLRFCTDQMKRALFYKRPNEKGTILPYGAYFST